MDLDEEEQLYNNIIDYIELMQQHSGGYQMDCEIFINEDDFSLKIVDLNGKYVDISLTIKDYHKLIKLFDGNGELK